MALRTMVRVATVRQLAASVPRVSSAGSSDQQARPSATSSGSSQRSQRFQRRLALSPEYAALASLVDAASSPDAVFDAIFACRLTVGIIMIFTERAVPGDIRDVAARVRVHSADLPRYFGVPLAAGGLPFEPSMRAVALAPKVLPALAKATTTGFTAVVSLYSVFVDQTVSKFHGRTPLGLSNLDACSSEQSLRDLSNQFSLFLTSLGCDENSELGFKSFVIAVIGVLKAPEVASSAVARIVRAQVDLWARRFATACAGDVDLPRDRAFARVDDPPLLALKDLVDSANLAAKLARCGPHLAASVGRVLDRRSRRREPSTSSDSDDETRSNGSGSEPSTPKATPLKRSRPKKKKSKTKKDSVGGSGTPSKSEQRKGGSRIGDTWYNTAKFKAILDGLDGIDSSRFQCLCQASASSSAKRRFEFCNRIGKPGHESPDSSAHVPIPEVTGKGPKTHEILRQCKAKASDFRRG